MSSINTYFVAQWELPTKKENSRNRSEKKLQELRLWAVNPRLKCIYFLCVKKWSNGRDCWMFDKNRNFCLRGGNLIREKKEDGLAVWNVYFKFVINKFISSPVSIIPNYPFHEHFWCFIKGKYIIYFSCVCSILDSSI